jgi:hypothetical protein
VLRVASVSPRYVLPFIQAFDVFAAFMLTASLQRYAWRTQAAIVASLCVAAGLMASISIERHPTGPESQLTAVLSAIRTRNLGEKSLLVPQTEIPALHYYFPQAQLRGYREQQPTPSDIVSRQFDAVLFPGYPFRLETTDQIQLRTP